MNRLALAASLLLLAAPSLAAFADLFRDETMRIDYFHTGAAGRRSSRSTRSGGRAPTRAAAPTWWTTSTSAATSPSSTTRPAAR